MVGGNETRLAILGKLASACLSDFQIHYREQIYTTLTVAGMYILDAERLFME